MRPPKLLLGLLVSLVALLATGLTVASADEDIDEASSSEIIETTLHPGDNVVGWVGAAAPAERLFSLIRNLEAVYAWDAPKRRWLAAYPSRRIPASLGDFVYPRALPDPANAGSRSELTSITPGMGLVLQIGGDAPVTWERSGIPARGAIELRTGWNLVSWQGLDNTTVREAVRGLGSPFDSMFVQTAPPKNRWQFLNDSILKDTNAEMRLLRGEGIWVNVNRPAVWLQPTGLLPVVRFTGGGSKEVQQRILEDVEAAIEFFRTQYAIEADATQFWIYAAVDQESLIATLNQDVHRDDFPELHTENFDTIRGQWSSSAAWVGGGLMVVKQHQWRDPNYYREVGDSGKEVWEGHHTMVHEYAHVVQAHISSLYSVLGTEFFRDSGYFESKTPLWIVEGTARFVEDVQRTSDGFINLRESRIEAVNNVVGKQALRGSSGLDVYPLGRAAFHLIASLTSIESWLNIFREMAVVEFGPSGQWYGTPSWSRAFERAVGISIDSFYNRFEAWRTVDRVSNEVVGSIEGVIELVGEDGGQLNRHAGVENIRMVLYGIRKGNAPVVWPDASGRFVFDDLPYGRYSFSLDFGRDCLLRYPRSFISGATEIELDGDHYGGIRIQIQDDVCAYQIEGWLLDSAGNPLGRVEGSIRSEAGAYVGFRADTDGYFSATAPELGSYRVSADIDGCSVFLREGSTTGDWYHATVVKVAGASVTGVTMQLSQGMCEHRISGTLVNADGIPLAGQWVSANGNAGSAGAQTAADGSFSFAVPGSGSYRLSVHSNGCWIYRGSRGATKDTNSASEITVSNADVTGIEFRLPEDPSTFCN